MNFLCAVDVLLKWIHCIHSNLHILFLCTTVVYNIDFSQYTITCCCNLNLKSSVHTVAAKWNWQSCMVQQEVSVGEKNSHKHMNDHVQDDKKTSTILTEDHCGNTGKFTDTITRLWSLNEMFWGSYFHLQTQDHCHKDGWAIFVCLIVNTRRFSTTPPDAASNCFFHSL